MKDLSILGAVVAQLVVPTSVNHVLPLTQFKTQRQISEITMWPKA
jgi:hypothetical protein